MTSAGQCDIWIHSGSDQTCDGISIGMWYTSICQVTESAMNMLTYKFNWTLYVGGST
jgi:hypothetical protein